MAFGQSQVDGVVSVWSSDQEEWRDLTSEGREGVTPG